MKTLFSILMLLPCLCYAPDIILLNNGKRIEGDILSYKGGKVSVKLANGRIVSGAITNITEIKFDVLPSVESDKKKIKTFYSEKELFRGFPSDHYPHKEPWKKNPLLKGKGEDWIKKNVLGCRLVLRNRHLIQIHRRRGVSISGKPFKIEGVEYRLMSGSSIQCLYEERRLNSDEISTLKEELKNEGMTYRAYREENRKRLKERVEQIEEFLAKLTITHIADNKNIEIPGSKISVAGIIRSVNTYPIMYGKNKYVMLEIYLCETKIAK